MGRATDHYRVRAREIQHGTGLRRAVNISVGDHWNSRFRADGANRFVFRFTFVEVRARASVHRDGADSGLCCDA